ncbi:MAG TPA: hypothetical protein VK427_15460 [Kofleriaceae bacterium]|nr:hypothetical protein [Kofleriaceae bacterium]
MGEALPAVIDDGTGVYFWDGRDAALGTEWVFLGRYRCERCGRAVTIVRFQRDEAHRLFVRHKQCPGGCDAEHAWLSVRG